MLKKFLSTIILLIITFTLGWQGALFYAKKNPANNLNGKITETGPADSESNSVPNQSQDLKLFWRVWDIVSQNYIEPTVIDDQNRIYGAIKGMVNSLKDPYTVFMDPKETKQFTDNLQGTLEGIGAELTIENGVLTVVSPLKGSPAEKAGLLPKDMIYKVNGELTSDMNLFEAIVKIRGEKGTQVMLSVLRKGNDKPLEMLIIREAINVPSVSWEMKDESIGYISINQFTDTTTNEFNKASRELLLKKPTGLILDLRFNGGGYLESSVDLLSQFLPGQKKAVLIKRRKPEDNEILYTSGKGQLEDIPMVVLVNEGSASAAEIVAGALQDYKRAWLIGAQTFGKGSVQEIENLEDGSSLRITIAKWHTPLDRSINKVGITPDQIVTVGEEDLKNKKDTQLEEALGYLRGK